MTYFFKHRRDGQHLNSQCETSLKPIYFDARRSVTLCTSGGQHQIKPESPNGRWLVCAPYQGSPWWKLPAPSGKILEWTVVVWISFPPPLGNRSLSCRSLGVTWLKYSPKESFSGIGMQTLGETRFPAAVTNLEICLSG